MFCYRHVYYSMEIMRCDSFIIGWKYIYIYINKFICLFDWSGRWRWWWWWWSSGEWNSYLLSSFHKQSIWDKSIDRDVTDKRESEYDHLPITITRTRTSIVSQLAGGNDFCLIDTFIEIWWWANSYDNSIDFHNYSNFKWNMKFLFFE